MFRSAHVIETECVRNQSISALFVPGMVLIRVWGQSPDSLTSLSLGRAACVCVSGGIAVGGGTRMSSCGWKSHIDKSWLNPHTCTHTQPHIISTQGTLSHSHQNAHIHTVSHSRLHTEHSPSLAIDNAVQSELHDVPYTQKLCGCHGWPHW